LSALLGVGCGEDPVELPRYSVEHTYVYGETVSFALGGDSTRFRTSGWAEPEQSGTWTEGAAASLSFRVEPPQGPLLLVAKLSGHVKPPHFPAQQVHLYSYGQHLGVWRVAEPGVFTATVPPHLAGSGFLRLDLLIPTAASKADFGIAQEDRRLGVLCHELTVLPNSVAPGPRTYNLGTPLSFGAHGGAVAYLLTGWSQAEAGWRWTEGTSASLEFTLPKIGRDLTVRARLSALKRSADNPMQRVLLYANGEKVAEWEVGDAADFAAAIPAAIPAAIAEAAPSLNLELQTPNATSPKALGLGEDARVLGVCVYELQITGR